MRGKQRSKAAGNTETKPVRASFEGGKAVDYTHQTKIAAQLVGRALADGIKSGALAADSFYGEDEGFKQKLEELT